MKSFSALVQLLLLVIVLSCNEAKERNYYYLEVHVENPKSGESFALVLDSLRSRLKIEDFYKLDSSGNFHFTDSISEPTFFFFQLLKTPVISDLILFPGDSVRVEIEGEEISIRSNQDQVLLDSFNEEWFRLPPNKKEEFATTRFKESIVFSKALKYWPYHIEVSEEAKKIVKGFERSNPNWHATKEMVNQIDLLNSIGIGEITGRLILPDTTGHEIDLESLRGKYVLIDFWGSWCKPCIEEFPTIKETYQRFNEKGFEIYGVALDSRDKWIRSVNDNKLPWINVIDISKVSLDLYLLNKFPSTYLIDPDGRIVAKEIRADSLSIVLNKFIKQ